VYLLALELTGSVLAAILGFLVLLTSNSFFVFAREVRLDMAVIAAILAALYFFVRGRDDERYLALIAPAVALGFLSKSVIVLVAGPIILAYAALYSQWDFLRSRSFWLGTAAAIIIWAPWHIIETLRYGNTFWDNYIGRQVVARASTTITGTNDPLGYINMIVPWYAPWNAVIAVGAIGLIVVSWMRGIMDRATLTPLLPLGIALGIITLFSFAQTHLGPYIMPIFPFFALAVAGLFHTFARLFPSLTKPLIVAMLLAVIAGAVMSFYTVSKKENEATPFVGDEMMLGKAYRTAGRPDLPLYALDWPTVETLNYYGNTRFASLRLTSKFSLRTSSTTSLIRSTVGMS
jgi:4-amino-4-deoxy-L-arabinose transferase-like glycosyltransferase